MLKLITNISFLLLLTLSTFAQFNQEWATRYNGSGNGEDKARCIAVDNTGNIYVCGYANAGGQDIVTIKYNNSGAQLWASIYNGPGNGSDQAYHMVLDAAGNVYVTGESAGAGTGQDYVVIKYNTAGVLQWASRYSSPGSASDIAKFVAVDAAGNVYVTGYSTVSGTNTDIATIKYNSAGVQQWATTCNGSGNGTDRGASLIVDATGNVFVAGYCTGSTSGSDCVTLKYNSSGVQQWEKLYNGPGNSSDEATAITTDNSGNIYITGYSSGVSSSQDYTTIKYNSSGAQQWVSRYNAANGTDIAKAIYVTTAGEVIITGYSGQGGTSAFDFATIKYNSAGVQQWIKIYNGTGSSFDYGNAMAVDANGNIYVTGYSRSGTTAETNDYATIRYSPAGVQQWVAIYNGPGNLEDAANSIALDAQGNVFVTGESKGVTSNYDLATLKYSQTVGIKPVSNEIPGGFSLSQNYPNPFNPETKISINVSQHAKIKVAVYDITSKEIEIIVNEFLSPGYYEAVFDSKHLSSGIYFCRMEAAYQDGRFNDVKKMILTK